MTAGAPGQVEGCPPVNGAFGRIPPGGKTAGAKPRALLLAVAWRCRVDAGDAGVPRFAGAIVRRGGIAMVPVGGISRRRQAKDHYIVADRLRIFWRLFGRIGVRL